MNHVVAITHVDMVKSIKLNIRTEKNCDCDMFSECFRNRWTTGIFQYSQLWGFGEWFKKVKISRVRQLSGWDYLVDVRSWRRMTRPLQTDRKTTVTVVFSAHWSLLRHHSLPECCCWSWPFLYVHSVPIFQQDNVPHHKAQIMSN